uniref:Uncharacterized protein n=1 Tax=Cacopsylla melanoneura TaxID=428564 RepID=A0A8D9BQ62_9HEMI
MSSGPDILYLGPSFRYVPPFKITRHCRQSWDKPAWRQSSVQRHPSLFWESIIHPLFPIYSIHFIFHPMTKPNQIIHLIPNKDFSQTFRPLVQPSHSVLCVSSNNTPLVPWPFFPSSLS